MLKIIIKIGIIIAVLTILTSVVSSTITTSIDNAFIYALSSLWALNGVFNVATALICFQIIVNFIIAVILFYMIFVIAESIHKD